MVKRNNALLFYYPKGFPGYAAFYKEMYSGFMQIQYTKSLYDLYELTDDLKCLEASDLCLNGLFIPIE